jgi:Enoyl-(Acyl carrier protein) reductase
MQLIVFSFFFIAYIQPLVCPTNPLHQFPAIVLPRSRLTLPSTSLLWLARSASSQEPALSMVLGREIAFLLTVIPENVRFNFHHFKRRASALAMAKQSPTAIYVTDLSTDNLEELADTIQKKYPSVKCYARKIDAASDEDVRSIINEAMTSFGRLDVFFANAGIASGTHIKDETAESFMRMMKINALR